MKNSVSVRVIRNSMLIVLLSAGAISLRAQSTAFTYQGLLYASGNPANGSFDLTFQLFNAAANGTAVGPILTNGATLVSNGLFTVPLDFGAGVFTGTNYWVQISARTNGGSAFTTLIPRLPITPAPYAISAGNAVTAATLSGTISNAQLANSFITVNAGTGLSGGGVVPLGGSTTLANTGVISVTGNADITASAASGAVTLGSTATDSDTASTIVKRDGSGNFSAGTITLVGGTLNIVNSGDSTGVGLGALGTNLSDNNDSTAIGAYALGYDGGDENTAIGFNALNDNTYGFENTAVGAFALSGTSGDNNNYNTAIGYAALENLGNGYNNIALGFQAGLNCGQGTNNIYIGNEGAYPDNDTIRIGSAYHANTFIAGIYNATVSGPAVQVNSSGQLGVPSSSRKFKQDIQSMADTSDELLSLRPVTFKYKPEIEPQGLPQFGLIAEEVEQVDPNLVVHDKEHGIYTVRYDAINAMLLNEFLKQHRKLEEKDSEIRSLEQRLERLESMMSHSRSK